jgi:HEAT repeat protein
LPLEFVYAAALAMLLTQLRQNAPIAEILTSVQRLCALARVGSVRLTRDLFAEHPHEGVAEAVAVLHDAMAGLDLARIDIDSTTTDTEFIKLGGLLNLEHDPSGEALREAARDLGLWNIRLWFEGDNVPTGGVPVSAAQTRNDSAADVAARGAAARGAAVAAVESGELEDALARQDARATCRILYDAMHTSAFATGATREALHLVVEALVTEQAELNTVQAVLEHARETGARTVFTHLMAAPDVHERRLLFDVAAALPDIVPVAREHISNGTWYVVRNAAALLGESKQPAAVDDLTRLLKHSDARVRMAAVVALGKIGGQTAMTRLESVLFDPSVDVRNRALSIVFSAPDSDATAPPRVTVHEEELTLEYQLEMITALAHVHTARARSRLAELARQDSHALDVLQVRLAAVGALVAGHRPAADAILAGLRDDPSALIRERVQASLG